MRALAEFIMRGRSQAGVVAILGFIVPLLSPVTVALVTLRKGAFEGTTILLIALVPALLSILLGGGDSVVIWITLLSLVSVYIPALVLRETGSLTIAIISIIAVAMIIVGVILGVAPAVVDQLASSLQGQFQLSEGDQAAMQVMFDRAGVSGMMVYSLAFNGLIGILLGRWLQAMLYNPGGFGEEFRALRFGFIATVIFFLGSLFFRFQGDGYMWWSHLLTLPLMLVAFAITHSAVNINSVPRQWLIMFYTISFVFSPYMLPVLACVGFIDYWINFRSRLLQKK